MDTPTEQEIKQARITMLKLEIINTEKRLRQVRAELERITAI